MTRASAGALFLSALATLSFPSGISRAEESTPPDPRPAVEADETGAAVEAEPQAAPEPATDPAPASVPAAAPPKAAKRNTAPESAAPPPPRPPEPMPLAKPATAAIASPVPEPEGYHGEPYRSPVPASLRGAEVIGDAAAHALWRAGIPFLDLLPTAVKPPNLPAGTLWRDPPHATIPGAIWLANTGYDALDPATETYFFDALGRISGGQTDAPLVFFCKQDCWMSWNGAKRAVARGYSRVFWYPGGTDGWEANGWPLDPVKPYAGLTPGTAPASVETAPVAAP
jgi:PQQ-dependent catabolism-associated CXXCW motif protein